MYICQRGDEKKPSRITILNGALLLEKEIPTVGLAGEEVFVPYRIALGRKNTMYVAAENAQGVLVFDRSGNFLHRMIPMVDSKTGQVVATVDRLPAESAVRASP